MTKKDFRVLHSEIIETYQFIEMRLKGICSSLCADQQKNWFESLDDHDNDPLGRLIHELQSLQSQKGIELLSPSEFKDLRALRETRNYWVHECFAGDSPILFYNSNGMLKRPEYGLKINDDLREARDWEDKLTEIEHTILEPIKNIIVGD